MRPIDPYYEDQADICRGELNKMSPRMVLSCSGPLGMGVKFNNRCVQALHVQ